MKIVYVVETYTEGLGYIDNLLPVELAKLGHEVVVVTCRLAPYYQLHLDFFGGLLEQAGYAKSERVQGIEIRTLDYHKVGRRILMKGLFGTLQNIAPDVVVVRGISSPIVGQVVVACLFLKFKIFSSTGQAYSALSRALVNGKRFCKARMANYFSRQLPGGIFALFIKKCIASSMDAADAVIEYGVPAAKTAVISLGVDTEKFTPVNDDPSLAQRRIELREALGVKPDEILCIWTGRMVPSKGLELLAQAVQGLVQEGHKYRALFVGDGHERQMLETYSEAIVHPFVKWSELPDFYRAADIAVWPRSITTSTLDASACGLPVIMSSDERATERWRGMGAAYQDLDLQSLKETLLSFEDRDFRIAAGRAGALKMESDFSWKIIAKKFADVFSKD